MPVLVISGYYGFNNIGDDAVLGGLLAGLRAAMPEVEPLVLSADPAATERIYGVRAIPRMDLLAIRAALSTADLFISGGGSLLQDVTSARSPLYYLGVIGLAECLRVPSVMLAQGVGPLRRPLNRMLAGRLLDRLQAVTVRDAASASLLTVLGVKHPPIEVTADPSFLLEPEPSSRVNDWWRANIPQDRTVLGIALRPWPAGNAETLAHIAAAVAQTAAVTGALPLFLPMQFDVDLPVAVEAAQRVGGDSRVLDLRLSPEEMLEIIGRCTLVTAMRLHALIFAVQRGVPALGLAYDPKVTDFAHTAGLPVPPAWEDITPAGLSDALARAWDQRDALHAPLLTAAAELHARARRNIEVVRKVLDGAQGRE